MENIFQLSWAVPMGAFSLRFDPLSIIFLIATTILVFCAGIYGVGYMRHYQGKRLLWPHILFFILLALSFFLVFTANNVILFLGAWEVMAMVNYFLIMFDDKNISVRKAGFLYLIATHCGTFCVFLLFFLLSGHAGSMEFNMMAKSAYSPSLTGAVFILAVLGFGVKAGFFPMHIWLPHAHPVAPSHISALMSGIAIKTGIYGLCRILLILGVLPAWCAYTLLVIGVLSGIMGVLYALGQHEIKKLLAYHSIENIGIITLGLGVGSLGCTYHMPALAVLGFAGALLHVLNHSLFKGLLFLSAGALIQRTNTGELDKMGGMAKTMPINSALFLVGSLSICGLPVFNGFVSEFIIYFAFFQGVISLPLRGVVFCSIGILSLALMGALALSCFTKVYGTVFLGTPRTILKQTFKEKEMPASMLTAMTILGALCLWIGIAPQTATRLAMFAGSFLAHIDPWVVRPNIVLGPLFLVVGLVMILGALLFLLIALRKALLGEVSTLREETWNCGFTQTTSRQQYTSSSFARSIVEMFKSVLLFQRHGGRVGGDFPHAHHIVSHVHDVSEERVWQPFLRRLTVASRKIDNNRIRFTQIYMLYIFLFLIFLLVWKLR